MSQDSLRTQIGGIEAQLRVLMASRGDTRKRKAPTGLRALKGALRGRGKFTPEELAAVTAKFRDEL